MMHGQQNVKKKYTHIYIVYKGSYSIPGKFVMHFMNSMIENLFYFLWLILHQRTYIYTRLKEFTYIQRSLWEHQLLGHSMPVFILEVLNPLKPSGYSLYRQL